MKMTFFGAVEEVTGSRYLIENEGTKILVDCGFFQGKGSIERNQEPFPVDASSIEAIVLTHAHIDHTGYIPALVKNGFKGKIYCSKATYALCAILLVDSGFLQQQAVAKINKKRGPKKPAIKPLYTQAEAERSLHFFQTVEYDTDISIGKSLTFRLISSGHILGASFVILSDGKETLTFSGDLGRPNQLLMKAPPYVKHTDYLVLESTYGNRLHGTGDPIQALGKVVQKTVAKGGMLIIPVFAVGRAQAILYCLYQLQQQKAMPDIPVFLDSPMAIKVNNLYCRFQDEHKLSASLCNKIFASVKYTPTVQESKAIDHAQPPAIIVAGSGMADGGRAAYHFEHFISDKKNTILFVGYQAEGTLGRDLIDGTKKVNMYGKWYKVRATIKSIDLFSAHSDYNEVLQWLTHFEQPPQKTFLTHGDLESAQSLKKKIEERFGWSVIIPTYSASFDLD